MPRGTTEIRREVQHPGRKPFSAEEVARNPIRAELG